MLLTLLLTVAGAAAAQAAVITVNTTSDVGPTDGECQPNAQCSLRQAINVAQAGDTVQLGGSAASPAVYSLTIGATLEVAKGITITGNGPGSTTIDGSKNSGPSNAQYRILKTDATGVSITNLTLANGGDGNDENFQGCSPCSTLNGNGGGAIFNTGGLTLTNVAFTGNGGSATPTGGALSNSGTASLTDVSFTGNSGAIGSALFTRGGTLTGNGVTFENNAGFYSGAAYLYGGTISLANTTVVGGGITNSASTLALVNDTFSNNYSTGLQTDQYATTSAVNTIISGCVPPNRTDYNTYTNTPTTSAITNDLGNNIDEDGSCQIGGSGDISGQSAHLASIADNGGPTRTMALVYGSPAFGAGNPQYCPANDQRGVKRPSPCAIGAFEPEHLGTPAANTLAATNIGQNQADLQSQINLAGEAGGFHFRWGTSPDQLSNSTPEVGAGRLSSFTSESQTLTGLLPGTTYYFDAVADNATGTADGEVIQHFTTPPGAPVVSSVGSSSVTDTSAQLRYTINPSGADTTYVLEYGPSAGDHTTTIGPFHIGSVAGDQAITRVLDGLQPGTTYHWHVVATNSQASADSGDQRFTTDPQITGTAGQPVTLTDSGAGRYYCPGDRAYITWGDNPGAAPEPVPVTCTPGNGETTFTTYGITAQHTYASEGHYPITITYPEYASSHQYAAISPGSSGTGTGTGTPSTPSSHLIGEPATGHVDLGTTFSGPIATFTDLGGPAKPYGYTATVNWGDGSAVESAAPTLIAGGFAVVGSHKYSVTGPRTVLVTISDGVGRAVVASLIKVEAPRTADTGGAGGNGTQGSNNGTQGQGTGTNGSTGSGTGSKGAGGKNGAGSSHGTTVGSVSSCSLAPKKGLGRAGFVASGQATCVYFSRFTFSVPRKHASSRRATLIRLVDRLSPRLTQLLRAGVHFKMLVTLANGTTYLLQNVLLTSRSQTKLNASGPAPTEIYQLSFASRQILAKSIGVSLRVPVG